MTTSTTKRAIRAFLLVGLLIAPMFSAASNPHWIRTGCQACHIGSQPVAGSIRLRENNSTQLCESCHGQRGDTTLCRHWSGMTVDAQNVGEDFRGSLDNGKLVCTTCHDITYQCEHPSTPYSFMNPGFLRERKSPQTSEYCFACHEGSGLNKFNPHSESVGNPPRPTCPLCHINVPEDGYVTDGTVDFTMEHDLNDACRGCHFVQPHPNSLFGTNSLTGWTHLVVPSAEVAANMRDFEAGTQVRLPLSPVNGEVMCATCHNPHDESQGSTKLQVSAVHKLRIDDICQACHDK